MQGAGACPEGGKDGRGGRRAQVRRGGGGLGAFL